MDLRTADMHVILSRHTLRAGFRHTIELPHDDSCLQDYRSRIIHPTFTGFPFIEFVKLDCARSKTVQSKLYSSQIIYYLHQVFDRRPTRMDAQIILKANNYDKVQT